MSAIDRKVLVTLAIRFVPALLTAWVSVGLMGYGFALKNYVDEERRVSTGRFGGPYAVVEGEVDSYSSSWLGDSTFKIHGRPEKVVVAREFVQPAVLSSLGSLLAPGNRVWVAVRARGNWAVQLDVKSPVTTSIIDPTRSEAMIQEHLRAVESRGTMWILFGLVGMAAFTVIQVRYKKTILQFLRVRKLVGA